MKQYLEVTADYNDADYVTERNLITEAQLVKFEPLFKAIKEFKPYTGHGARSPVMVHGHNFPIGDGCRARSGEKTARQLYVESGIVDEDTFAEFEKYIPTTQGDIHTITKIMLVVVYQETRIL